ncbi:MAG: class I SAM-dependent methyltransferase [Thermodesulfobacteriota bacterium]
MTQERFDNAAATWDDKPKRREVAAAIAAAIKREVSLSRHAKALEVGCGTGLVTCELAGLLKKVVAIDTSQGMLAILQEKITAHGLGNVEALAFDLSAGGKLASSDFDLIYSAMTLHHIKDTASFLAACRSHLKPGGILALADLDEEDGSFHDDMTGVEHCGFGHKKLADLVTSSGFGDVRFVTAHRISKEQDDGRRREYPVFLMIARAL